MSHPQLQPQNSSPSFSVWARSRTCHFWDFQSLSGENQVSFDWIILSDPCSDNTRQSWGWGWKTLTSLNKESRPIFLGDNSIWSFASLSLSLPLALAAFGGPEGNFSLAIRAFGAFEFIVPKYYYRLGKTENKESSRLIFKEFTVFKVIPLVLEKGVFCQKIPFFLQGTTGEMGIFLTENSLF